MQKILEFAIQNSFLMSDTHTFLLFQTFIPKNILHFGEVYDN